MGKTLMSSDDMKRSLRRISYEIMERYPSLEDVVLVGIRTRGYPIAQEIASNIDSSLEVMPLDIREFRDDIEKSSRIITHHILDNKHVVIVDDVLYTGRSTRAALEATLTLGRPASVSLAVLVDRGHRELPIRADFVGKNIPSAKEERIHVKVVDIDGINEVSIE